MPRRWRAAVLASSLLLGAAAAHAQAPRATAPRATAPGSTVLPGVGAHDPRRPVDAHTAPWTALARLQIPGVSRCTAVLVGPRLALTAAHCLYGVRLGHFLAPASVHVLTGYNNGDFTHHTLATALHIAPGFDPLHIPEDRGADFALVELADPIGSAFLGFGPVTAQDSVALGGYSQDRNEIIEADPDCRITGLTSDAHLRPLLVHSCSATRGTSGAPLLTKDAQGIWHIIGLEVGARPGERGGVAIPARALQALLARMQ